MNIIQIKRVIADHREELESIRNTEYVQREKLEYVRTLLDEKIVKVISGPRRSGKSIFCHQLLKDKNYAYINFDDERLIATKAEDLDQIYAELLIEYSNPDYFLFDEIQNITGWELFVNRLNRNSVNLIITGSNSKMLSKELATHLTGRHFQIEIFPFSFAEYLLARGEKIDVSKSLSTKSIASLRSYLNDYIVYGGFPEIKNIKLQKLYLRELFEKIILKDIVERYNIREIQVIKELAVLMLNYYSSLFTYNKICNLLNCKSVNTVKDYAGYLEETYLMFYVNKQSFKIQEELRSPRKIYSIDTGMINALSTSMSPNTGKKLENLVYLAERRKGNRINYYSDDTCEVDFVSYNENNEITLIQVAQDISDTNTYNREVKALTHTAKKLLPHSMVIITENTEDTLNIDGNIINIIPVWKYLLTK